jgi:small neutral amino acid transporter SnatA (MarC family)
MDGLYAFCITVLMGFFAIMNPIGNVPIYMGLVDGYTEAEEEQDRPEVRVIRLHYLVNIRDL